MMGHLCRIGAEARIRHTLPTAGHQYSPSRMLKTAMAALKQYCVHQKPSGPPTRRLPAPPVEAMRPHLTGVGPDLLAEPSGRGCSCCGDFVNLRDRRQLIARPETGPSSRGMSTVQAASASTEAPSRSHEEEAEALQGFIAKRIELFEQYRQREKEAVCVPSTFAHHQTRTVVTTICRGPSLTVTLGVPCSHTHTVRLWARPGG